MGYYTSFDLSVAPPIPGIQREDVEKHISNYDFWDDIGNPESGYLGNYYDTWYEAEENMRKLSKAYPEHLFTLCGNGDSAEGDHWIAYFQNGKMQHCQGEIVYPEYDLEKME